MPLQGNYSVSTLKGPPFIGMFAAAKGNPIEFMLNTSRQCGDIIDFTFMGQRMVQLNHPELLQYILVENHKNYRKNKIYLRFQSGIGLGLLTSNGDKWKRDRQKIQPMFNRSTISDYHFDIVNLVSEKYKQRWLELTKNGSARLNITEEMANITIEIILKAIFGKHIDDEMLDSLHRSYVVLVDYLKDPRVVYNVDFRKVFRHPVYLRFKRNLDNVNRRFKTLSDQYSEGGGDRCNMLTLLLEAQKENPELFNYIDIRDHCATMVFAGFESTSILLQWLWFELDDKPDIVARLRQNITQNEPSTAKTDSSQFDLFSIGKMDYLAAAIKEILRLYPSFWLTGREPITDDYFGDYKIESGTMLIVPQLAMHRHPRWWDNPMSFIPERFLGENEAKIPDGLYFPFSLGPRKCIGSNFAEMEAKTVMAKLLPLFNVKALNKENNPLYPGVSLKLTHPLMAEISRA